jgi:hypothetical protein
MQIGDQEIDQLNANERRHHTANAVDKEILA